MFWTHRSFWLLPLILAAILGTLAAIVSHTWLRRIYEHRFPESRRERLFLASVGFFTTVLVVRALTIAIHNNIGPFHDVSVHGRHIHHLVWGIILLLTVGYARYPTKTGASYRSSSSRAGPVGETAQTDYGGVIVSARSSFQL
jgi:hypothetical protein